MNLAELTNLELLRLQALAVEELRSRNVVRTTNNPIGDYTEWLAAKTLALTLAANSSAGYDAISAKGAKVQIKGRRVTSKNSSWQLSAVRNLEEHHFDELVAVVFDQGFEILEAVSIPHLVVKEYGVFNKHQNGHILYLRDKLLIDSRVTKLRKEFIAMQESLQNVKSRVD